MIEIGIGEHAALAFLAVADIHIAQRAGLDVAIERLDRAIEFGRSLRRGLEAARYVGPQLALTFGPEHLTIRLHKAVAQATPMFDELLVGL